MSDLMRLVCEAKGHVPIDIDPTGGDPRLGGPVAITICDRCDRELPHSQTAEAFNEKATQQREADEQRALLEQIAAREAWQNRRRWWQPWRRTSAHRAIPATPAAPPDPDGDSGEEVGR